MVVYYEKSIVYVFYLGKYIYIEASFKKPNQSAILRSPPIRPTLGAVCFKFAYHMHGAHVNALYIYKLANGRRTR